MDAIDAAAMLSVPEDELLHHGLSLNRRLVQYFTEREVQSALTLARGCRKRSMLLHDCRFDPLPVACSKAA